MNLLYKNTTINFPSLEGAEGWVTNTQNPQVINEYSNLMLEVFGERGKHARSAVGMISLPWNLACEIETIIEVRE